MNRSTLGPIDFRQSLGVLSCAPTDASREQQLTFVSGYFGEAASSNQQPAANRIGIRDARRPLARSNKELTIRPRPRRVVEAVKRKK